MGVDVCLAVKTTDGNPPNDGWEWSSGEREWEVEAPYSDEEAAGATHRLWNGWRYYGPGYARGPWPLIAATILSLMQCENVESVWYYDDTGDCPKEPFTLDDIAEMNRYWVENGTRPYHSRSAWAS